MIVLSKVELKSIIQSISSTIYLNIFILSTLSDTFKERGIVKVDVKGAYLSITINEFIIVKLVDEQFDTKSKIDKVYNEYIRFENGRKVIYLILNSKLCRTL